MEDIKNITLSALKSLDTADLLAYAKKTAKSLNAEIKSLSEFETLALKDVSNTVKARGFRTRAKTSKGLLNHLLTMKNVSNQLDTIRDLGTGRLEHRFKISAGEIAETDWKRYFSLYNKLVEKFPDIINQTHIGSDEVQRSLFDEMESGASDKDILDNFDKRLTEEYEKSEARETERLKAFIGKKIKL